jgi:hypothetical protein
LRTVLSESNFTAPLLLVPSSPNLSPTKKSIGRDHVGSRFQSTAGSVRNGFSRTKNRLRAGSLTRIEFRADTPGPQPSSRRCPGVTPAPVPWHRRRSRALEAATILHLASAPLATAGSFVDNVPVNTSPREAKQLKCAFLRIPGPGLEQPVLRQIHCFGVLTLLRLGSVSLQPPQPSTAIPIRMAPMVPASPGFPNGYNA